MENERKTLLRFQLAGTLLSAVLYGLNVSLVGHCLILFSTKRRQCYTSHTRRLLTAYIASMLLLSTCALIQEGFALALAIGLRDGQTQGVRGGTILNEPIVLPVAIWGADVFMVRRCMILYMDAPRLQRALIYVVLIVSTVASLGCGVLYYLPSLHPDDSISTIHVFPLVGATPAIALSAIVNFVLTILIVYRLHAHQDAMRRVLGQAYSSPCMRVVVLCSASCALIVGNALLYVVLFAIGKHIGEKTQVWKGALLVPLLALPHVCAMSPIFIVYHVARGRGLTTLTSSDYMTPNLDIEVSNGVFPIQFAIASASTTDISGYTTHPQEQREAEGGSRALRSTFPPSEPTIHNYRKSRHDIEIGLAS